MSSSKLQYKKMTLEELVVLAQQDDFKALEEFFLVSYIFLGISGRC